MSRDPTLYLEDISEAGRKIQEYLEGISFDDFCRDTKTQDAVICRIEGSKEQAWPFLAES